MWSRWKWYWGVKEMPIPLPLQVRSPVIREWLWKKTQIEQKVESDESQYKDNGNSDSEISLEKIRSDVSSSFTKNKKRRLDGPVRHTSSSKIYVEEMCWQYTSINQTKQLPFDIDSNCIFEVPINTVKHFGSTKDGRHWGPLNESKKSCFSRDRYIATCRGFF